jgi:hypothetical protein
MDWVREAERNWDVLERILALLLAFAALADRACGLPAPARHHLLAILGRSEAEARCFVMGTAFGAPAEAADAPSLAAGHAGRLAASFRALALVLGAILARPRRPQRSLLREAGAQAGSSMPPRGPEPFPAPDTS